MSGSVNSSYGPGASAPLNDLVLDQPEPPPATQAVTQNASASSSPTQVQSALGPWASGAGAYTRAFAPANPDPAAAAARVMDTGVEWGTDDYDARMAALGKELGKGDASYRTQLMTEIFKRDPHALGSWLTPERANDMRDAGSLSREEKASIAEGLAGAYNRGAIPQYEIGVGTTPGTGEEGRVKFSPLDNAISGADASEAIERAQRMREFIDFIDSSKGPEVTEFRQKYAQHLLDEYVLDPALGYHKPLERDAAASLAGNLLGGDIQRPELTTSVLSKYDSGQIKSIIEAAARSDGHYGEEALQVPARDRMLDPKDVSVPDGAQSLMLGVARTQSAQADRIALDFARMPTSAPGVFEGVGAKDRVDALTLAVASHHKPVLDALTDYDNTYIGNESKPNLQQYMQNASDLGALFKLTLFNPDSTYSASLQEKMVGYAGELAKTINNPGANGDEVGHMAMLQAGLTDGVRQGFEQLARDQAKVKETLGFLLDLAVSAVPFGKMTSDGLQKVVTETFGNNPRLQEALKAPLEKLVDQGSGKLTDEGKKALLDSLDTPHRNLEIARSAANTLNETFMKQVSPSDYDRKQIDTDYKLILVGITTIRGK